jgi:hypothetical protein
LAGISDHQGIHPTFSTPFSSFVLTENFYVSDSLLVTTHRNYLKIQPGVRMLDPRGGTPGKIFACPTMRGTGRLYEESEDVGN